MPWIDERNRFAIVKDDADYVEYEDENGNAQVSLFDSRADAEEHASVELNLFNFYIVDMGENDG